MIPFVLQYLYLGVFIFIFSEGCHGGHRRFFALLPSADSSAASYWHRRTFRTRRRCSIPRHFHSSLRHHSTRHLCRHGRVAACPCHGILGFADRLEALLGLVGEHWNFWECCSVWGPEECFAWRDLLAWRRKEWYCVWWCLRFTLASLCCLVIWTLS